MMKNFKELRADLTESSGAQSPDGGSPRSAHNIEIGVHQIEDPRAIMALNAFLESFFSKSFLTPKYAMAELRAKLNTAGLDFNFDTRSIPEESETYKLTLFGGRQGMNMMGEYTEDDGITPKLGYGLNIKCDYQIDESGLYNVKASIVPDSSGSEPSDDGEAVDAGDN